MGWLKPVTAPVEGVTIRRTRQARRMTLRVSQLDGRATLTMPQSTSDKAARRFLEGQADWIAQARTKIMPEALIGPGTDLPVEGTLRRVQPGQGRQARLFDTHIETPSPRALQTALKHLARDRAMPHVDRYAADVGREVTGVSFRDTRSRWGSCTSDGRLMLSWRLILAPPDVFDYVIAHEVAHLVEMNHSAAFWSVVADLFPDYKRCKTWLRTEGSTLHRYRFD